MNIQEKIEIFLNETINPSDELFKLGKKRNRTHAQSHDELMKHYYDLQDKFRNEKDPEKRSLLRSKMQKMYTAANKARQQSFNEK